MNNPELSDGPIKIWLYILLVLAIVLMSIASSWVGLWIVDIVNDMGPAGNLLLIMQVLLFGIFVFGYLRLRSQIKGLETRLNMSLEPSTGGGAREDKGRNEAESNNEADEPLT